ncbi:MAG TPA: MarR family transcriptional regulator [Candidatus Aphodomonas merdavium]|nr:MarR family transcriptional regulator [Candidatus Aphodomonas merdavium]
MPKEALNCSELMKRIADSFGTKVNKDLQQCGVTLSQMKMLIHLGDSFSGSATLKELEKALGTSQATIAGIAVRLEKKKLLTGSIDPQDRRVKHVSLSKSGWAMYYDAQVHIEEEEERLVTGLTGEERAQLKKLLQKIYDTLK